MRVRLVVGILITMMHRRAVPTAHGDAFVNLDETEPEVSTATRLRRFEANAVGACFVATAGIALDALSALPPTLVQNTPASLRCLSLVLVACIGSPIVRPEPNPEGLDLALEQRGVLLLLLGVAAALGNHRSSVYVRCADGIFVLIAGFGSIGLSIFRSKKTTPGASLFAALLVYLGLRVARAGAVHSTEVSSFTVLHDAFETQGFGLADAVCSTALVAGGIMLVCTGAIVLLNDDMVQEVGSSALAHIVAQNTAIAFAAAFIAQLSCYANIENLGVLFGPSACTGDESACAAAYRARRLYVANSSPASLWCGIVAAAIFSLPKQRRCSSRDEYYKRSNLTAASGSVAALVSAACLIGVWTFATVEMEYVSAELIVLYAAIPAAWFIGTPAACALSIAGNVLYMSARMGSPFGYDLNYMTHWSLAFTAIATVILGLATLFSRVISGMQPPPKHGRPRSRPAELITGVVTIAILSLQLGLTIGTLALVVGYDGSFVTTDENQWRKAGFEFTVQHSLSFFFIAAVYGSRFELGDPNNSKAAIGNRTRRFVWFITPPVIGVVWFFTLVARGVGSPYDAATSAVGLATGLVAAVVPWCVCGLGI